MAIHHSVRMMRLIYFTNMHNWGVNILFLQPCYVMSAYLIYTSFAITWLMVLTCGFQDQTLSYALKWLIKAYF